MDNNLALVFTMEKVGSSTCMQTFRESGFNPDRGTRHNLDYLGSVEKYAGVITPVRDPIARNVSYFFEIHGNDILPASPTNEQIHDMLFEKVNFDDPLTWFDQVYKPFTGIDVYKHKFNRTRGWSILDKKFLIIQTEKLSEQLPTAFEGLFGLHPGSIHRARTTESRAYGELYTRFVEWVQFPADLVDHLLGSKYSTFFYTKKQLEGMRKRWVKNE